MNNTWAIHVLCLPRFSALLFGISPIERCDFLCPMLDHFFWTLKKLKSKKKQGISHVLAWLKMIIKKTIKHQNNLYSVKRTHDHQTLNVSSNLTRLHRHKNLKNSIVVLLQVACPSLLSTQCVNWAYFSRFKS